MAEKLFVVNDLASRPVAVQMGVGSFYHHTNVCSVTKPSSTKLSHHETDGLTTPLDRVS